MTAHIVLVFLLPVLIGGLLVHVLWPDRQLPNLVFKAFLGVGLGLGTWSLLYFIYLLGFAGQNWFVFSELAALLLLAVIAVRQDTAMRPAEGPVSGPPRLTGLQRLVVGVGCVVFILSLTSTVNYLLRRRQGDWDAWMMFNRAARFVYLDPTHWLESFSPRMDPIFHPDYPLLLAMNIASGWQALGRDNPRVPMIQSAVFAIACAGLITSGLAAVKSVGQASLGLIILWGIPEFVNEGAREMADVPLAFYVLATGILVYLFVMHKKPGLAILAGFSAGVAAWTKNEGIVLVMGASAGVALALIPRHSWRSFAWYLAGLAAPLAIVLYFKIHLAPPGDILSSGETSALDLITNPSRHLEILNYLWQEIWNFGSWGIAPLAMGILPVLLIFFLLFRIPIANEQRPAFLALGTMLVVQLLGYYGAYLISPYDLAWHLSLSTTRLVLQIFPLLLFLVLCASAPVESILRAESEST